MSLPRARFGRTGHLSSRVVFGAAALGAMRPDRAAATLELVLSLGINHIDTAAGYGDSELRLAPFLAEHRDEIFLATKTNDRTADSARRSLETSLTRMGVDTVDLIQLHNLVEDDEWAEAHGPGGAVAGLVRARDEGLVRHIGITGHGTRIPGVHLRSLERFDHDTVLFPLNHSMMARPDYRADVEALLEVCRERDIAVQTIKAAAHGRWDDDDTAPRFSWYRPLPDGPALERSVRHVLAYDGVFLNSSSDVRLLPTIVRAAGDGLPAPTDEDLAADAEELGITALFDGGLLERI